MRIHILGVSGTFMSGVAILAKQAGHEVTGSDMNVYPPMSLQLTEQGITWFEGYDPAHLDPLTDCVIVGNVIKRGNPLMEYVMEKRIPYLSGPEWLSRYILQGKHVLAVAGTHGKTTTSSLLAWILDYNGLQPGFLIGGVPENFGVSARMGKGDFFVIEADEYDSAFFDKRSKFIHYRPTTLILNNLEYDHADIFPDLAAIKQQFHFLVRTLPANGLIVVNGEEENLAQVIKMGCWTPLTAFGSHCGRRYAWEYTLLQPDASIFAVDYEGLNVGEVHWPLLGTHNAANALAAIAAARHVGVLPQQATQALTTFKAVKRRLEVKGIARGVTIYDDFAHHPTAIALTLAGLRAKVGQGVRIIAIMEFGSYTMRTGVHKDRLKEALQTANQVVCKATATEWGLKEVLASFSQPTALYENVEGLVQGVVPQLQAGDHVVVMSNSSFEGVHQKLLDALTSEIKA